jgi:membrane protease YdiL (CAAX protease family)
MGSLDTKADRDAQQQLPLGFRAGQVWFFLLAVCVFSAASDTLRSHVDHPNPMLERFAMWGPAGATAITCLVFGIKLRTLGWHWPPARWLSLSYVLPLLYAAPVYLAAWLFLPQSFGLATFMSNVASSYNLMGSQVFGTFVVGVPLLLTVGVIASLTWALGEEIGWRGFLFPRLMARFGFNGACLASGLVWAIWHYPGLIWGHYNAGTNPAFALSFFTLSITAEAFISGWLRVRSGSIWPCALLHASHNLVVQAIFDGLTVDTGPARYLTTEFGFGLTITTTILAYVLCRRAIPDHQ